MKPKEIVKLINFNYTSVRSVKIKNKKIIKLFRSTIKWASQIKIHWNSGTWKLQRLNTQM